MKSAGNEFSITESSDSSDSAVQTSDDAASPAEKPRRHRTRRIVIAILAVMALLVATAGIVAWRTLASLDSKIDRFGDPFASIPATDRPSTTTTTAASGSAGTAMNLLVLGSDSRISAGDPTQWAAGAQRTDAIMLVHIPADRKGVYVMSIPRDSWVNIPGHGKAKINAAFSWGGPALTIQTVEKLTGVRIDHIVITDFTGFAKITDLIGGVDITVPQATTGMAGNPNDNFSAGTHHMDGATALTYVRQRYGMPGGDFDRIKRQQNWIRTVIAKSVDTADFTNPGQIYDLIDTMASATATDSRFTMTEMRNLVMSLRSVRSGQIAFFTVPTSGTGSSSDGQSIVRLDPTADSGLWKSVVGDTVGSWLTSTGQPTLGATVR